MCDQVVKALLDKGNDEEAALNSLLVNATS
jgi:hypothetical protein